MAEGAYEGCDCGSEHSSTGGRAWCFDCSEWCYPGSPCEVAALRKRVDALTAALRGILDWEGDHAEYLGQCAVDLGKWPCPFERARRLLSESVGED